MKDVYIFSEQELSVAKRGMDLFEAQGAEIQAAIQNIRVSLGKLTLLSQHPLQKVREEAIQEMRQLLQETHDVLQTASTKNHGVWRIMKDEENYAYDIEVKERMNRCDPETPLQT